MANTGTPPRRKPRFKERNAVTLPRAPRRPAAELPAPPPGAPAAPVPQTARGPIALPRLTLEGSLYAAIVLLAFILRFWNDGARAMHGDESVHAWIAWNLFKGAGYQYDPVYHGPFQFPLTAVFYFLFGVSNLTGRLLSILFGTALVLMPYFLRHYLGRAASLLSALLIAFSPAFVYVSRLERDDSFTVFFAMTMAIGILGYLRTRRIRYIYVAAASAALSLTAMENTYITVFMFGTFLLLAWGAEWLQGSAFGASLLAFWDRTGGTDRISWPYLAIAGAVLFVALILTVTTGLFLPVPLVLGMSLIALVVRTTSLGARDAEARPFLDGVRSITRHQWFNVATLIVAILFLLFSTFGTNLKGVWDASQPILNNGSCSYNGFPLNPCRRDIVGGLFYWLSQHNVHRGGQPWFYYTLLYSLYEQLVAIFAIGGLIWAFRRPSLITTFLAYWAVLAYGIYSWAGEKFSWLMIHPLLPMTLLASMFIVNALHSGAITRVVVLAALGILGLIQLHSLYEVNYVNGADPVEMMVYVQSAPDTPVVANQILSMSNKVTNGPDMHVTIDSEETWPFAWYLRDMPNIAYPTSTELTTGSYLSNPVILVDETDDPAVHPKLAKNYTRTFETLRWWFPEDYKTLSWHEFFRRAVSPNYWGVVGQWLFERRPFGPKSSVNFYYYVKKGAVSPF
jgi:uncharacterized protein (TIGR03663 family)